MKFKLACLVLLPCLLLDSVAQEGGAHDKEFWQGIIAEGYALPQGEQAYELLLELNLLLDSPDAVLRDEIGYAIPANWIYRQGLLTNEQLCEQVRFLSHRLTAGIETEQGMHVLGRSYGALNLSILVATDLKRPYLDEAQFDGLLDSALTYLAKERDLRGWSAELGWIHSAAHTADLLKYLGRHPKLDTQEERARMYEGLAMKIVAPSGKVFVHGEDERLARALLSLLQREDFEMEGFDAFRGILQGARDPAPAAGGFSPVADAAKRNAKNVLRVLLEGLRGGQIEDIDRAEGLEERILGSLRALS